MTRLTGSSATGSDVVIVGSGMVGCALAARLGEAGLTVTVIDRATSAAGASGGNMGLVLWSDAEPGVSLDLTRRAWLELPEEMAALGEVEFRSSHVLTLIRDDQDPAEVLSVYAHLSAAGFSSEIIDRRDVGRLEPGLAVGGVTIAGIQGAVYQEQAALNPFLFTLAWEGRARRAGARFLRDSRVTGFRLEGGRVTAAETEEGLIEGDVFVLSAGAWTRQLALTAGLDLPQYHILGELLVTEPVPPTVRGVVGLAADAGEDRVAWELRIAERKGDGSGLRLVEFAVVQAQRGNLVVGQVSHGGPDLAEDVRPGCLRDLAASLVRFFPSTAGTAVIRSWAKPVPFTPDHQPIVGYAAGAEGLFLLSGLKSTIIITPLLSRLAADYIVSGRPGPLAPFSPERFLQR